MVALRQAGEPQRIICLRFEPYEWDLLEHVARLENVPITTVVERVFLAWLEREIAAGTFDPPPADQTSGEWPVTSGE